MGTVKTQVLPCGNCTACCEGEQVFIHPELGDDARQYRVAFIRTMGGNRLGLQLAPNGDCCYLDREKGCTIWDRRPAVCRELDCRTFLKNNPEKLIEAGVISRDQYEAAVALKAYMNAKPTRKIPGRKSRKKKKK